MAKIVFGMNQSLDGYVDHDAFAPDPVLFRHFIDEVRGAAGGVYGRVIHGLMRYWDTDQPGWSEDERAFAAAWRNHPQWVASRTLTEVGPNATLIKGDVGALVRQLRSQTAGEIHVGGPALGGYLADLGLIDEYRLYVHPVVLGRGRPLFTGPRPPMRLVSCDRIGEAAVRLICVPA